MYILCEKESTVKSGSVLYPLPMTGFTLEDKEFIPFFLSKDLDLLYLYVNDIRKEFKMMLFKDLVNYIETNDWEYNSYIYDNILDIKEIAKINLLSDIETIEKADNEIKKIGLESKYLVSRVSDEERDTMLNKYIDVEKNINSTDYGTLLLYVVLHKNTSLMIETGSLIFYVNKLEAHIMAQFLNLDKYKIVQFQDLKKYNQNVLISQTQNQVCFLGFYRTINAIPRFVFNQSGFPSTKSYVVDKQIMKDGYNASFWLLDSFVSDELSVYENNLELLVLTNSTPADKLEKLSKQYKELILNEKTILQPEDIKEPNVSYVPILKNGI